jgi:hypothetical protein
MRSGFGLEDEEKKIFAPPSTLALDRIPIGENNRNDSLVGSFLKLAHESYWLKL